MLRKTVQGSKPVPEFGCAVSAAGVRGRARVRAGSVARDRLIIRVNHLFPDVGDISPAASEVLDESKT
ncbi:hypothetical protein M5K25_006072 [Dendrobium thyrsiflorum]|uniref:Uncharacterized protein n=1 Tax=Dendrobium thyrsiflorum TaxID=117978 RepID=A0ABD0VAJ8_DENTH